MYEGRLVRLRAVEPGDAGFFHRGINDPEVKRGLLVRYPKSLWDEESWIESVRTLSFANAHFVIENKTDGRNLGNVALRGATPEDRTADLGVVLFDKARWSKGFGSDAVRTACRFGFEEMGLERIELWVFADNERARRAYQKVGFVHEGTGRSRVYRHGARMDELLMGLLQGELT
jgi:RimJ/RimL family protein N-acetyltransferase